eukprot:SAG22_NODE_660_length_8069_cov_7.799951_1_plen_91_part_10
MCETCLLQNRRGAAFFLDAQAWRLTPSGRSWPRSHLACHRYFCKYPDDIPTGGAICTSRPDGAVHGIPPPRKGMDPEYGSGQISGMSERYM